MAIRWTAKFSTWSDYLKPVFHLMASRWIATCFPCGESMNCKIFPQWPVGKQQNVSSCLKIRKRIYIHFTSRKLVYIRNVRMLTVSTNRAGEQQGICSDGDERMCTALAGTCKYIEFWFVWFLREKRHSLVHLTKEWKSKRKSENRA